jgi:uncharacterized protein (TIGR03435 family)
MKRMAAQRIVSARLRILVVLGLSLAVASSSGAQTRPPGKPGPTQQSEHRLPEFEIATIQPVDTHHVVDVGTDVQPGGRIRLNGMSLRQMVAVAFNLSYWQIEGSDWMDRDQYNLVAQPPERIRATMPDTRHTSFEIQDQRLRLMLQALLAERFKLRVHRETKPGKVFLLRTSGKALQLHTTRAVAEDPDDEGAAPASFGSIDFAGKWVLYNTTMPQLAKFASDNIMQDPVLDRTALPGSFDYWGPPEDWTMYQNDPAASFLNMLHDVGLKLVPAKGPVVTLVIDHAEPPAPN